MRGRDVDIISVDEVSKGVSDSEVLELAREDGRVILSFDDDFARLDIDRHHGVIHLTSIASYDVIVRAVIDISENISGDEMKETVVELSPKSYM